MLELSVAALRPLIGRTERPTLTALAGVDDADQLDQGSFSPRALELLRSAVSTTFTLATVKDGVPIFRERASKKTGSNDRCHLEAMVESGILAVLVHGTTCVPKFFVRKVPTAELTTEQKLALNSRLLAVGLNMDTYSAHAKPSKLDVTEAALGPVCSELPPGITGRKAPGFINDAPGLALAPTQARDSPGPWSLDDDTSSCSGVDSMESEQPLSDLGDGGSDRTKRPRSSWVSTKPATNMCPRPVKKPHPSVEIRA